MSYALQGKVALVTGAARGQGRSHALALAREGADVIAIDVCAQVDSVNYAMSTPEDLAETGRLVEELDRRVVTVVADVRERSPLAEAVNTAVAELGRLDIVVANAGISPLGPDVGLEGWFDAVQINLVGEYNTIEAALPHLGAGASIVCIGSVAAMLASSFDDPNAGAGGSGYAHAKRQVARLVHDLAIPFARKNIRINAVHPGNVDTEMVTNEELFRLFRPDLEKPTRADIEPVIARMHKLPVGLLEPEGISDAVLFLASDASRYITGQQLKVDAGWLLTSTTSGAPA